MFNGATSRPFAGTPEVQDVRCFVEAAADAVPTEIAHDAEALALDVRLDGVTDVAERRPRPHYGDAAHERLIGDVHQHAGTRAGGARCARGR